MSIILHNDVFQAVQCDLLEAPPLTPPSSQSSVGSSSQASSGKDPTYKLPSTPEDDDDDFSTP